jgi:hypothetical protein
MSELHSILILAAAFVAVFFEAWFDGFRDVLGAQIDLLPALMVYAGLHKGLGTVALTAICGGLWFDSLSANPLGVKCWPASTPPPSLPWARRPAPSNRWQRFSYC